MKINLKREKKQVWKKIPKAIKTKHVEAKELFKILYSLIADLDSKKKYWIRVSPYELALLNTRLQAITSDDNFREYIQNQKLKDQLFG